MVPESEPCVLRRGWLKNNNPPGDLSAVARCGAKTRRATVCRGPAMPNGRCRFHGGKSTGPRTPEGRERSRQAHLKHGYYTREAKAQRARTRALFRAFREFIDAERGEAGERH